MLLSRRNIQSARSFLKLRGKVRCYATQAAKRTSCPNYGCPSGICLAQFGQTPNLDSRASSSESDSIFQPLLWRLRTVTDGPQWMTRKTAAHCGGRFEVWMDHSSRIPAARSLCLRFGALRVTENTFSNSIGVVQMGCHAIAPSRCFSASFKEAAIVTTASFMQNRRENYQIADSV